MLRLPIMLVLIAAIWPLGIPRYTIVLVMTLLLQWVDFRAARAGTAPLSVIFFDKLFSTTPEEPEEEDQEDGENDEDTKQ